MEYASRGRACLRMSRLRSNAKSKRMSAILGRNAAGGYSLNPVASKSCDKRLLASSEYIYIYIYIYIYNII